MSKFVNAEAKGTLMKAAKYMAMCGLLLLAGFLTFARPNVAEAGIAGSVKVINDSDFRVLVYVDGAFKGILEPGESDAIHVGDAAGPTLLEAAAEGGPKAWELEINDDLIDYTFRLK